MKTLFFTLAFFVALIGRSPTANADEHHYWDHHDHYWNDQYWHEHRYGYWHGYPGYWTYQHHAHVFIHLGPLTIAH